MGKPSLREGLWGTQIKGNIGDDCTNDVLR